MHGEVQHYYANVLQSSADLKTDACCPVDALPQYAKDGLAKIHDEIIARYYGCGLVLPEALEGARILDLGCGTGRDCYLLSYLVGANGRVVGVDMTSEQLAFARRHQDYHTAKFGFPASNTEFREANIENLESLGFAENLFDLIVSNCVINLATDKQAVLDQGVSIIEARRRVVLRRYLY